MEISAVLTAFKDIIFPAFGAIVAIYLISCIPGAADEGMFPDDKS